MTDRGQLDEIPAQLLDVFERVIPGWLERCVVDTAVAQLGHCPESLAAAAAEMARVGAPEVVARLEALLAVDVDQQRGAPLAVVREATVMPGAVLAEAGVPAPERDEFDQRAFPGDVYGLSPASWSDVDPALHEPGIMWGAWKASTVLRRRRSEGLR